MSIVVFAPALIAQTTLRRAVEMAVENNSELQMAKEDMSIAKYDYKDVKGQLFPQISLNASYSLEKNYLPESMVAQRNLSYKDTETASFAGQVRLQQLLFSGGKLINGIRVLDKVKTLQSTKYELALENVMIEVINAYYNLYLAIEGLNIQRQALVNAERHFSRVENLYTQGLVSEYDMLRAELEVSRLYPEVLKYENLKNIAEENFKRITGLSGEILLELDLESKTQKFMGYELTLDDALNIADNNRMELKLINLATDMYKIQHSAEKSNYLPNLMLQADITKYTAASSFTIEKDDFGTMGTVGLLFTMPIFTGMSNTSKALRAKHELRKSEFDVINTTELIQLDIRQTWQTFFQSIKYLETQEKNMDLAERALFIAQARFNNQTGIQLEVFDAQIQHNAAQISLAQAKITIIKDYYALNKAIGNKLNKMIEEL